MGGGTNRIGVSPRIFRVKSLHTGPLAIATDDQDKRCGATNRRTGKPCNNRPIKGKKRCRMHGGKSTGAKSDTRKHGLYASKLHPDMLDDFHAAPVGSLDDDIRLGKATVAGLLARCAAAGGDMEATLTEQTVKTWADAIREAQSHVRRLEQTRAQIKSVGEDDPDAPTSVTWVTNEIEGVGLDDA